MKFVIYMFSIRIKLIYLIFLIFFQEGYSNFLGDIEGIGVFSFENKGCEECKDVIFNDKVFKISDINTGDKTITVVFPEDYSKIKEIEVTIKGKNENSVSLKVENKEGKWYLDGVFMSTYGNKLVLGIPQPFDLQKGNGNLIGFARDANGNVLFGARANITNSKPVIGIGDEIVYLDIEQDILDEDILKNVRYVSDLEDDLYQWDNKKLGKIVLESKGGYEKGKVGMYNVKVSVTDSDNEKSEKNFKLVVSRTSFTFVKKIKLENKKYNVGDKIDVQFYLKNTGTSKIKFEKILDTIVGIDENILLYLEVGAEANFERDYALSVEDVKRMKIESNATIYGTDEFYKKIKQVSDNGTSADENGDGDVNNDSTVFEFNRLEAKDDFVPFVNGEKGKNNVINVLENDVVNGKKGGVVIDDVKDKKVLTLHEWKNGVDISDGGVSIDPDSGFVNVRPGTGKGMYRIQYNICQDEDVCDKAYLVVNVSDNDVLFESTVKRAKEGVTAVAGEEIEYTFVIYNTGSETFKLHKLEDEIMHFSLGEAELGSINGFDKLEKKCKYKLTKEDVIRGQVVNMAKVEYEDPDGNIIVVRSDNKTKDDEGSPIIGRERIPDGDVFNDPTIITFNNVRAYDDTFGRQKKEDGGLRFDVISNDKVNVTMYGSEGNKATIEEVMVSIKQVKVNGKEYVSDNIKVNSKGEIELNKEVPYGNYEIEYTICHKETPNNCDTVKVIFSIEDMKSKDDVFSFWEGETATSSVSVLDNDTFEGSYSINYNDVNIKWGEAKDEEGNVVEGISGNDRGKIKVLNSVKAGKYTMTYETEAKSNGVKMQASIVIFVLGIEANDDVAKDYIDSEEERYVPDMNIFDNDFINGKRVDISMITGVPQILNPNDDIIIESTGKVRIRQGLPAGVHVFRYQICDKINTGYCAQASITVKVKEPCRLKLYNTFSANTDSKNNFLRLDGIECFDRCSVLIFNRWGEKVFESDKYENNTVNGFTGIANKGNVFEGKELPKGVYFVIIEYSIENKEKEMEDWIYIN